MAKTPLKIMLKSWKGDYLHRPDGPQGVTTFDTGVGNEWIIDIVQHEEPKIHKREADLANEKFAELETRLAQDPAALQEFFKNPELVLQGAGIPRVGKVSEIGYREAALPEPERSPRGDESESIHIERHWWGLDFIMNKKLAEDIAPGTGAVGGLGALIGHAAAVALGLASTGPVQALLGASLAAVFALKAVQIKVFDLGNGVHWLISWIQWASLLPLLPYGPAVFIPAATLLFHPLRPEWCRRLGG